MRRRRMMMMTRLPPQRIQQDKLWRWRRKETGKRSRHLIFLQDLSTGRKYKEGEEGLPFGWLVLITISQQHPTRREDDWQSGSRKINLIINDTTRSIKKQSEKPTRPSFLFKRESGRWDGQTNWYRTTERIHRIPKTSNINTKRTFTISPSPTTDKEGSKSNFPDFFLPGGRQSLQHRTALTQNVPRKEGTGESREKGFSSAFWESSPTLFSSPASSSSFLFTARLLPIDSLLSESYSLSPFPTEEKGAWVSYTLRLYHHHRHHHDPRRLGSLGTTKKKRLDR